MNWLNDISSRPIDLLRSWIIRDEVSSNVLEVQSDHQAVRDITAEVLLEIFGFLGRYDPLIMTLVGKYITAATQLAFTNSPADHS